VRKTTLRNEHRPFYAALTKVLMGISIYTIYERLVILQPLLVCFDERLVILQALLAWTPRRSLIFNKALIETCKKPPWNNKALKFCVYRDGMSILVLEAS
jgi:hypothetical protein